MRMTANRASSTCHCPDTQTAAASTVKAVSRWRKGEQVTPSLWHTHLLIEWETDVWVAQCQTSRVITHYTKWSFHRSPGACRLWPACERECICVRFFSDLFLWHLPPGIPAQKEEENGGGQNLFMKHKNREKNPNNFWSPGAVVRDT